MLFGADLTERVNRKFGSKPCSHRMRYTSLPTAQQRRGNRSEPQHGSGAASLPSRNSRGPAVLFN